MANECQNEYVYTYIFQFPSWMLLLDNFYGKQRHCPDTPRPLYRSRELLHVSVIGGSSIIFLSARE